MNQVDDVHLIVRRRTSQLEINDRPWEELLQQAGSGTLPLLVSFTKRNRSRNIRCPRQLPNISTTSEPFKMHWLLSGFLIKSGRESLE
jgi:hypothetical protein